MLINLGTEEKPMYVEPTSVVCVCKFNSLRGEERTSMSVLIGNDIHVDTPLAEVVEKINAAKIEHERQVFWDACCAATMWEDAGYEYDYNEAVYCAKLSDAKLKERDTRTGYGNS